MKKIFLFFIAFALANTLNAQTATDSKKHKIVFQLTSDDTLVHKVLMKQLNNIVTVAPKTKIEVVVQGGGLTMLMLNKTIVEEKIAQLIKKNVSFVACEFSMADRKITKEMMIPEASYVPYGILEIVSKQEDDWSYIKSGF